MRLQPNQHAVGLLWGVENVGSCAPAAWCLAADLNFSAFVHWCRAAFFAQLFEVNYQKRVDPPTRKGITCEEHICASTAMYHAVLRASQV